MRWKWRKGGDAARALRRAARAARCLGGDPVAANPLTSALAAAPTPRLALPPSIQDDLLAVQLAAEHGMGLQEFLALEPMDLIELLWPDQKASRGPGAARAKG